MPPTKRERRADREVHAAKYVTPAVVCAAHLPPALEVVRVLMGEGSASKYQLGYYGAAVDEPTPAEVGVIAAEHWAAPMTGAVDPVNLWAPVRRVLNRLAMVVQPSALSRQFVDGRPHHSVFLTRAAEHGEADGCMVFSRRLLRMRRHMSMDRDGGYLWVTLACYREKPPANNGGRRQLPARSMPLLRVSIRAQLLLKWMLSGPPPAGFEQPPGGWVVMHKCNSPGCLNPHHLMWGSIKENCRRVLNPQGVRRGNNTPWGSVGNKRHKPGPLWY